MKLKGILDFIDREFILIIFLVLFVILYLLYPRDFKEFWLFVDWRTIKGLLGLFIITSALEETKCFSLLSYRLLRRVRTERQLGTLFVLLSALLSTFLTNDVTLFIIIPLTLSLQKWVKNDLSKLIVFEAIAVNVGSSLTALGNPQNLFLWHKWGLSFLTFIGKMLPLVSVLLGVLLLMLYIIFPKREIVIWDISQTENSCNWKLFAISSVMLVLFVVALERGFVNEFLFIITVLYLFLCRKVFYKLDWGLLFLFVLVFIDFHILANIPVVNSLMDKLNLAISRNVFLVSIVLSQFISNVPSSVLMSKFSTDWQAISYGVNVGGNGLVVASFANLIALRIARRPLLWLEFHKYSILYLLVSSLIVAILFFR